MHAPPRPQPPAFGGNVRPRESLVSRSDSKNPATTCRGITSNGRPCRRALASQKSDIVSTQHPGVLDPSSLYCWQHRDQAPNVTSNDSINNNGRHDLRQRPIPERTSIDSLVGRLGIMSVADLPQQGQMQTGAQARPAVRNRPPRTQPNPNYKLSPNNAIQHRPTAGSQQPEEKSKPRPRKQPGFWASLCCMTNHDDDDYLEVVRHKQRMSLPPKQQAAASPRFEAGSTTNYAAQHTVQGSTAGPRSGATRPRPADSAVSMPMRRPLAELAPPNVNTRTKSTPDTRHLLSFIPRHLSPQTTSALLTELSKPISPHDEEGYIYIFWLTDSNTTPSEDTAASLLSAPTPRHNRRPSDVMSEFSYVPDPANQSKRTIKLKIGRANNVHRRMNEWTRQCGYNLSLVRWYPYVPSTRSSPAPPSPPRETSLYPDLSRPAPERLVSDQVRKVQHAHRVERLIHLELAAARVKKDCAQCGKEHREWFEVEATEAGVKGVDEVIRRWVRWANTVPKVT